MAFGKFVAKHEYMYRADLNTFVPPGMPTVPKSNNRELIKKKVNQHELSQLCHKCFWVITGRWCWSGGGGGGGGERELR